MNIVRQAIFNVAASRDAEQGITSIDDRIVASIGPDPVFNPATNLQDRELAQRAEGRRLAELRDELAILEDRHRDASTTPINIFITFAFTAELFGWLQLGELIGYEGIERVAFAGAVSASLLVLTGTVVHGDGSPSNPAPDIGVFARVTRAARRTGLLVLYAAIVIAVVILRIADLADDGEPLAGLVPNAILVAVACIGPAILLDALLRKRAPLAKQTSDRRDLERRIRREGKLVEAAKAKIRRRDDAHQRWVTDAARLRATYAVAHRLATATRTISSDTPVSERASNGGAS